MTTYFAFAPPPNNSFSFQPTLDGHTANAIAWYNVGGQRWYLSTSVTGLGTLFNLPLIGSPPKIQLQDLTWALGFVTGHTVQDHGFNVLDTVDLVVNGCTPEAYNGRQRCFITDKDEFVYPLPTDPGLAQALGTLSYDINLGAGYLQTSSIVYRDDTRMFEVTP